MDPRQNGIKTKHGKTLNLNTSFIRLRSYNYFSSDTNIDLGPLFRNMIHPYYYACCRIPPHPPPTQLWI